jgi:hypothetical protein
MTHLVGRGASPSAALTRGYHIAWAVGAAMVVAGVLVLWVGMRRNDLAKIAVADTPLPT